MLFLLAFLSLILAPRKIGNAQRGEYATSIDALIKQQDWPSWVTDIRHQAVHGTVPSLATLRFTAKHLLGLFYERFWVPQKCLVEQNVRYEQEESRKVAGLIERIFGDDNSNPGKKMNLGNMDEPRSVARCRENFEKFMDELLPLCERAGSPEDESVDENDGGEARGETRRKRFCSYLLSVIFLGLGERRRQFLQAQRVTDKTCDDTDKGAQKSEEKVGNATSDGSDAEDSGENEESTENSTSDESSSPMNVIKIQDDGLTKCAFNRYFSQDSQTKREFNQTRSDEHPKANDTNWRWSFLNPLCRRSPVFRKVFLDESGEYVAGALSVEEANIVAMVKTATETAIAQNGNAEKPVPRRTRISDYIRARNAACEKADQKRRKTVTMTGLQGGVGRESALRPVAGLRWRPVGQGVW